MPLSVDDLVSRMTTEEFEMCEGGYECAICLDGNAEYAVVPCGHRCLCASCIKAVSECPVCRGAMTAVLRVFV